MIFVWGTRLYGKVDEVPGKFHVATQFGHLWFIPLFPARSWVIFKQHGNHFRGVKIGWNLKSILVGWAVAASTLLIAIGGPILLIVAQRSYPKTDDFIPPATAVVAGIATLVVIFTVPGIRRASHARAMMLARKIGATAEFQQKLDEHFNRPFGMGGAFPVEARSAPQVASADAQPIEATGALIETIETNPSASKSAPKLEFELARKAQSNSPMPLQFDWSSDLDLIAQTRLRCYAKAQKELKDYQQGIRDDDRAKVGDYLVVHRDGEPVGTTTSHSMTMWMRGASLPMQGIAWVGTVRSARRSDGIASQLMRETLKKAREREQVISALMPFRVSFYEHFGFGVAEKRIEWTVPLAILPHGKTDAMRFYESADDEAVRACRQRQVEAGQCDIETSLAAWKNRHQDSLEGFEFVDPTSHSWMFLADQVVDGRRLVRVIDNSRDSIDALKRQLHALANLRDQYSAAIIQLPSDFPLDQLLRERQIPHRMVDHLACGAKIQTRMMIRVLDHARFFEKLNLPKSARGSAVIAIKESEGTVSKFRLEIEAGHATAKPTDAAPDIECRDVEWSAIVCGAIRATTAAKLGLIDAVRADSLEFLDCLAVGPAPFSGEYF